MKAKHLVILLFAALSFAAILIDGIRVEANAKATQSEMVAMFESAPRFPGATKIQHSASHKISNGIVGSSYASAANFAVIRTYYDAELAKLGWNFVSEEPLLDWGKDLGRRAAYYKKGRYRASLNSARDGFGLCFTW